jgi:hypothetical protein
MEANVLNLASAKTAIGIYLKPMQRGASYTGCLRTVALRVAVLIALAPAMDACTSSRSAERSYNEDKLSQLVAHQTTFTEAQQLLGPPQSVTRQSDGSLEAMWRTGARHQNGSSDLLFSHAGGLAAQMAGMFGSRIPMAGAVIGGLTSIAGSGLGELHSNGTSDARVGTATLTFNSAGVLDSWTSMSEAGIG